MKKLSFLVMMCSFFAATSVFGQSPWSGSSLNGNTYRNGNVGIGQSSPSALLHITSVVPRAGSSYATNLRLEVESTSPITSYFWDINSGVSLDFASGMSTANMTSRMSIGTNVLTYKGNTLNVVLGEYQAAVGSQNAPSGSLGQYFAFGANALSGGWQFTGNSSNNGGAIIQGDDKGNLFFITRGISTSGNTMTPTQTADNVRLRIHSNGKISIGTGNTTNDINEDNDEYLLFVKGGTLSEEVTVRAGWADYVFNENYTLLPLEQVETFINTNGHLPNTPSAADLNGTVKLGEATVKQQEKIEEIYLHLIELNKRMKALEVENAELKKEIEALKN
jgi:hypothetical protein